LFGLLRKSLRETWSTTLLFGVAAALLLGLLTYVLPRIMEQMGPVLSQMEFFRSFVTALIGSELGDQISPESMQAYLWVHPVLLALVWGHEIIFCTRLPAGEIERGTIDILLSLPVSHRKAFFIETLLCGLSGAAVLLAGWLGHLAIAPIVPEEFRPQTADVTRILINLYCVYIAVGGIAFFFSSISRRRGRAVGAVFGIVLVSFLINFLAQFWDPAADYAFLSIMDYYQPAIILREKALPIGDITTLLIVGGLFWIAGCEAFARRDIYTS